MTPAERIAAEIIRSHYRRLDGSGASYSLADEAIDALMGDADDVHLHRHPDGTITTVPMEVAWIGPTDDWWRDTPGGAA